MSFHFRYKPGGETLKRFLKDATSFVRGLRGPVGSGKSACCCVAIFMHALAQKPGPDGIRRSKWAVVRNSYPMLRTTTIETWLQWFPEEVWGKVDWTPPYTHVLKKGDIELEVIFIALDRPDDVKKLLSLELTGAWINEAREVPKQIVDACSMRVGRFPSMKDGGPSWYGVIMDTNAPDDDHWWPIMAGEAPPPDGMSMSQAQMLVKPPSWSFYNQPGGMIEQFDKDGNITGYRLNPEAENLQNLTPDYYPRIIEGKGRDWISVYVLNRLANLSDGKPVYPDFREDLHVAKEPLQPAPNIPITIGLDFGLTPSAIFTQRLRHRWLVLRELVAVDMGMVRFSELLRAECATSFPGYTFHVWGDPAGDQRVQTDERTPFQILRQAGVTARPAPSNDVALRIEAVAGTLTRHVDGQPGLLIDPRCATIRKGFSGGYHYRRLQVTGAERYELVPNKNKFSHPHDALQYGLIGGGEGRALTIGGSAQKPRHAKGEFDVMKRQPRSRRTGAL